MALAVVDKEEEEEEAEEVEEKEGDSRANEEAREGIGTGPRDGEE